MGFPSPAADYIETRLTPESIMGVTASTIIVQTDEGCAVVEPGHKVKKGSIALLCVNGEEMFAEVGNGKFRTNDGMVLLSCQKVRLARKKRKIIFIAQWNKSSYERYCSAILYAISLPQNENNLSYFSYT